MMFRGTWLRLAQVAPGGHAEAPFLEGLVRVVTPVDRFVGSGQPLMPRWQKFRHLGNNL